MSDADAVSVESFILDFDGNLYDKQARVEFFSFLRDERKFDDISSLGEQIKCDAEEARAYFAKNP